MNFETPLFFQNLNKQRLFGILHEPDPDIVKLKENVVLIFCHPLFEEKLHCHRIVVNFARYAAKRGFYVFRFDYFGDGESEGFFEDASIASRISDIYSAINLIYEKISQPKIILFGIRMGATLAHLAIEKYNMISYIIL